MPHKDPEARKAYHQAYRLRNKDVISSNLKRWKKKNPEKVREEKSKYRKRKRAEDAQVRIKHVLRERIRTSLRRAKTVKKHNTNTLLGCTVPEFLSHIENQFVEGMSLDNYGFKTWHIDHILPCSSFDLTDPEQQKLCFHYTNLQPLWAEDNLQKSDKLDWKKPDLYLSLTQTLED